MGEHTAIELRTAMVATCKEILAHAAITGGELQLRNGLEELMTITMGFAKLGGELAEIPAVIDEAVGI